MRYAAVVLALAAPVFGQSLADLPSCSVTCLMSAVSLSGCSVTDTACECGANKEAITAAVIPCVMSTCSDADQAKVLQITNDICAAAGGSSAAASSAVASTSAVASASVVASASAVTSASARATQSSTSSTAGQSYGIAGALIAGAAILAL